MKTICPHCKEKNDVDDHQYGDEIECQSCGEEFTYEKIKTPLPDKKGVSKVFCPHCDTKYSIKEAQYGKKIPCSNCNEVLIFDAPPGYISPKLSCPGCFKQLKPDKNQVSNEIQCDACDEVVTFDQKETPQPNEKGKSKVFCIYCDTKYSISTSQYGKEIPCNTCGGLLVFKAPKGFVAKEIDSSDKETDNSKDTKKTATTKLKGKVITPTPVIKKNNRSALLVALAIISLVLAGVGYFGYSSYQAGLQNTENTPPEPTENNEPSLTDEEIRAQAEAKERELAEAQKAAERLKRKQAARQAARIAKKAELERIHSASYEGRVVPILERTCLKCHDEDRQEGDLNLELYLEEQHAVENPDLWEKIAKVVSIGQMPPPKEKAQLTDEELTKLQEWSIELSTKWDNGEMGTDPGKTTLHRLNKFEYNYTIRDLFGLKIRPGDSFPEDGAGEAGFINNADALFLPPLLVENYFKAAGTIVNAVYADRSALSRYLIATPVGSVTPKQAAEQTITFWATFIFRKLTDKQETKRLVKIFEEEYEKSKNYREAMKTPLYAMLISPNFIYRSTLSDEKNRPYKVDQFELASRLSYFLWSSAPDKELYRLANTGKLTGDKIIEEQVIRMLKDEKSKSLGRHLGGQWFGWEDLRSSVNPDETKFPQFTLQLRVDLYQESTIFFNKLIETNSSIYELLDSDYTYLNERLAKFYNIPGVTGTKLRKVNLTDKTRGGVLGMGSVLSATSLPLRSSPSIRGAYVLEDLLGINLPDPPMDVEPLPEDDRHLVNKSFRDTLTAHRENPACSSCHGEIDPIGFGLEAFDAIGRFRTKQNGVDIDTSGTLPDGTEFSTPAELKKVLLSQKEQFARNTVKKMLAYALGRDLTPYDRPVIKKIADKVIQDNGNIQTALIEVAKSYPFTHSRGENYKPKNQTSELTQK